MRFMVVVVAKESASTHDHRIEFADCRHSRVIPKMAGEIVHSETLTENSLEKIVPGLSNFSTNTRGMVGGIKCLCFTGETLPSIIYAWLRTTIQGHPCLTFNTTIEPVTNSAS